MSDSQHDIGISKFVAKLGNGLARANKFRVEFNLPPGVDATKDGINTLITKSNIAATQRILNGDGSINIFCHTCTLPQRSLSTYPHKQLSGPYLVPYSQNYEPITMSFYADKMLNTRRYFDLWQTAVINTAVNTMNYYNEFTSDVMIYVLDDHGNDSYKVQLVDCYPLSVGMVDMTYGTSELLNVIVTLSYKQWVDTDTNLGGIAK